MANPYTRETNILQFQQELESSRTEEKSKLMDT